MRYNNNDQDTNQSSSASLLDFSTAVDDIVVFSSHGAQVTEDTCRKGGIEHISTIHHVVDLEAENPSVQCG